MKKKILFLAFFSLSFIAFNQNYSYTFSGQEGKSLSAEEISNLENKIKRIEGVKECKIRYKEERNAGEILLFIEESMSEFEDEQESPFNATELKSIVIKSGLNPINFKSLN